MAAKKSSTRSRGRSAATGTAGKGSGAKQSVTKHAALERSSLRKGSRAFRKAIAGMVVVRPGAKPSPFATEALRVLSAGVQDALRRLADRGIPAVVVENGHRIEAVPRKTGGRYVVVASVDGDRKRPTAADGAQEQEPPNRVTIEGKSGRSKRGERSRKR